MKPLTILTLAILGSLLTSCYYVQPTYPQQSANYPGQQGGVTPNVTRQQTSTPTYRQPANNNYNPNQTVSSQSQKQLRNQESNTRYTPPSRVSYPTAEPIPGKPGFVYNPYTYKPVDVRGIASGRTVTISEDPNTTEKFIVP